MDTAFLLILLTLSGSGQMAVNFVNTDDMDTCQGKTILLDNILSKGGVKIIENRCLPSPLKFSPFSHKPAASGKRQAYAVRLGEQQVEVKALPNLNSCTQAMRSASQSADLRLYCATSTQTPLG